MSIIGQLARNKRLFRRIDTGLPSDLGQFTRKVVVSSLSYRDSCITSAHEENCSLDWASDVYTSELMKTTLPQFVWIHDNLFSELLELRGRLSVWYARSLRTFMF